MQNTRFINTPACAFALLIALASQNAHADAGITPAEARAIAKEAYTYANPVVDGYRILHSYFVDSKNPDYKAPWNQIKKHFPRLYTRRQGGTNPKF